MNALFKYIDSNPVTNTLTPEYARCLFHMRHTKIPTVTDRLGRNFLNVLALATVDPKEVSPFLYKNTVRDLYIAWLETYQEVLDNMYQKSQSEEFSSAEDSWFAAGRTCSPRVLERVKSFGSLVEPTNVHGNTMTSRPTFFGCRESISKNPNVIWGVHLEKETQSFFHPVGNSFNYDLLTGVDDR